MAASCASSESSDRGRGCTKAGAWDASGGIDTRDANGADVCGNSVASGSHGAAKGANISVHPSLYVHNHTTTEGLMPCSGASCLGSLARVSAVLLPSDVLVLSDDVDGMCARMGLLVFEIDVSRVVTVRFSVRRSRSSADRMLLVRVLPDNVLLCDGRSGPDDGEFVPDFDWVLVSKCVLVVFSWVLMRGTRDETLSPAAEPFPLLFSA